MKIDEEKLMLKNSSFWVLTLLILLFALPAAAVEIEVSAFGDMTLGFTGGDPADEDAAALFEAFGTDPNPVNIQKGFGNVGVDFAAVAELTDRLIFLSELNFQLERGGTSEVEVDLERVFLEYRFSDRFNVQVGQFFTPIGFFNRTLYSRAWLMNSIQIPDLFEEEIGLLTTHTNGVHFFGNLPLQGAHSLNYAVSVANGRGGDPTQNILARDPSNAKAVTAMLEWVVPNYRDFRIGVSGWVDKIKTFRVDTLGGSVATDAAEKVELREIGLNPHIAFYGKPFNLIVEYAFVRHKDLIGNLSDETFDMNGLFVELSLNVMGGKLHPYLRYDVTRLPEGGGPYYPLREEEGVITRHFIPAFKAVMVGASYDLYAYNRIKAEYLYHLDGPRPEHGFVIQTAFGF
jgi:hypothetical protein